MPTFSIVTATYNRPELLERMITSVLNQTYTDWELLITDDSTNNETARLIEQYAKNPKIIYQKNEENRGVGYTRNRGIDIAKGVWVTFLDDDDYYADISCLEQIFADITQNNKYPWLTYSTVTERGEIITQAASTPKEYSYIDNCLFGRGFRGDAVHVIKRYAIGDTRIDEEDRTSPEWRFFYELAQKIGNFLHIPRNIVVHEYINGGLTKARDLKAERKTIVNKLQQLKQDGLLMRYGFIMICRYFVNFPATHRVFKWYKDTLR